MLTLLVLRHAMVVEPAPAVADDFMPVGGKGRGQLRILLQRADDAEDADLHLEALEDAQQAPATDARSVFEHGFDHRTSPTPIGGKADVGEQILGMRIALENRMFAAGFDVQIEIECDPRVAGPARMRKGVAVTEKVPHGTVRAL